MAERKASPREEPSPLSTLGSSSFLGGLGGGVRLLGVEEHEEATEPERDSD